MSTVTLPVIDPVQLRRQTLDDPAREIEILALFSAELERLMRQLEEARDIHTQGERLRAIISLARNTGAARLLHDARLVEAHIASGDANFQPLREAAAQTLAYVRHTPDAGQAGFGAT